MTILGGLWGLDAKLKLFHKVKVEDLLALSSKDWDRFSLTSMPKEFHPRGLLKCKQIFNFSCEAAVSGCWHVVPSYVLWYCPHRFWVLSLLI